jgi:hypothetical protein
MKSLDNESTTVALQSPDVSKPLRLLVMGHAERKSTCEKYAAFRSFKKNLGMTFPLLLYSSFGMQLETCSYDVKCT